MNALDEADRLFAQLLQPALRPAALGSLRTLARRIVLEAAAVCEARAAPADKPTAARAEARKCADAIRHFLLCNEGESICLHCEGKGCARCKSTGIKTTLL